MFVTAGRDATTVARLPNTQPLQTAHRADHRESITYTLSIVSGCPPRPAPPRSPDHLGCPTRRTAGQDLGYLRFKILLRLAGSLHDRQTYFDSTLTWTQTNETNGLI